ncbi:hypothetical protein BU26DRAFT_56648 [Trematosphaeria pertusa]|uniref:Uncharacterized protein n=1 Tax=Trematosphaeria pertusa TaxID=390896 RepID=A0A6A6I9C9_9PLEO|nr:uncharacterized protein BU26DRAFT_56648 [Trematosphaeria pertusa]KAF2246971.1 hypothetical protein BU26DRAFT_56648 [Trematosphaeria pertusa]
MSFGAFSQKHGVNQHRWTWLGGRRGVCMHATGLAGSAERRLDKTARCAYKGRRKILGPESVRSKRALDAGRCHYKGVCCLFSTALLCLLPF